MATAAANPNQNSNANAPIPIPSARPPKRVLPPTISASNSNSSNNNTRTNYQPGKYQKYGKYSYGTGTGGTATASTAPPPNQPQQLPSYNVPPSVAIKYLPNARGAAAWLSKPPFSTARAIGFDMEWRPSFKRGQSPGPVALIQLATLDMVLLLHIHHMKFQEGGPPEELAQILASRDVLKVGVNIQADARKLYSDYGLTVNAMLDLAVHAPKLAKANCEPPSSPHCGRSSEALLTAVRAIKPRSSLQTISEAFLNKTIDKAQHIRRSNWETPNLDRDQIRYSAADAHVGLAIYQVMCSFRAPGALASNNEENVAPPVSVSPPPVQPRPGPWDALLPPPPSIPPVYSDSTKYILTEYEPFQPPTSSTTKCGGLEPELIHFSDLLAREQRGLPNKAQEENIPSVLKQPAELVPTPRPELFQSPPPPIRQVISVPSSPVVGLVPATTIAQASPLKEQRKDKSPNGQEYYDALESPPHEDSFEMEMESGEIDFAKLTEDELAKLAAVTGEEWEEGGEIDFEKLSEEELARLDGPVVSVR